MSRPPLASQLVVHKQAIAGEAYFELPARVKELILYSTWVEVTFGSTWHARRQENCHRNMSPVKVWSAAAITTAMPINVVKQVCVQRLVSQARQKCMVKEEGRLALCPRPIRDGIPSLRPEWQAAVADYWMVTDRP